MALDRSTQPIVKDASGVLVGVAQIRVGRPSIRGAVAAPTVGTKLLPVGKSNKQKALSNTDVIVVKPTTVYSANGLTTPPSVTVGGTYTGKVDGNLIIRACTAANAGVKEEAVTSTNTATAAEKIEIFDMYGKLAYTTTALSVGVPTCTIYGITLDAADFTSAKVGDTWVIPCWTNAAINIQQTGIVSPFSMLDATDSIGGMKSASFQPKIDSVKKLQSGFPSYTADQIIDSVSVSIEWSGYEYTNSKLALLKQMISRVINTGELSSISVEVVMRTRGGSLVRMWVPSCTFSTLPTYSPQNDYSDVTMAVEALKQTEFSTITTSMGLDALSASDLAIYNAWLSDSYLYNELTY